MGREISSPRLEHLPSPEKEGVCIYDLSGILLNIQLNDTKAIADAKKNFQPKLEIVWGLVLRKNLHRRFFAIGK